MKANIKHIADHQPRSPQVEDGYTRIANELFDALLGAELTGRELLVALTIIRKTYGYNKKQDDMSASQIGSVCHLARTHVTAVLKGLEAKNIIHKRSGAFGSVVGIQKDHARWLKEEKKVRAPSTELVLVPNQYAGSTESVQVDRTESVHTKDNLPKDNLQKTKTSSSPKAATAKESAAFVEFYQAYPRKSHRKEAAQAYAKLNPDADLQATILAGLARCKKQEQWRNPKFIPHPATWLNAGGWMDEVQTEYAADELEVIRVYNDALGDMAGAIDEAIFSESRAAAIRAFRELSDKPQFWLRFFPWIRENADLPPHAGFDWLITPEGFSKVKGGQFNKR